MGDEEERPPAPRCIFYKCIFQICIFLNHISDRPDPDSLEGLQLTINEKSDETLECTRRMREMCAEAKDAGMKTLIALDDQEVNISIQPRSDMIKPKSSTFDVTKREFYKNIINQ